MNNQITAIRRVNDYYQLIKSYTGFLTLEDIENETGITIHEIAEATGYSEKTVFDDFRVLYGSGLFTYQIEKDYQKKITQLQKKLKKNNQNTLSQEEINQFIKLKEESETFGEENREAKENKDFSEEPIFWKFVRLNLVGFCLRMPPESESIALDADEAYALKKLNEEDDDNLSDIVFKENTAYHHLSKQDYDNLDEVFSAFEYLNAVSFTYENEKIENILPLRVMYDAEKNLYAIYALYKKKARAFRIDKIKGNIEGNHDIKRKAGEYSPKEKEMLERAPYIWGFQCDDKDYVGKVKVYFYNQQNVWNKVRKKVECRAGKKLTEITIPKLNPTSKKQEEEILIYEDIVYGKEDFKSWILGFGNAAVVVEPESLRNEILELMKKWKESWE